MECTHHNQRRKLSFTRRNTGPQNLPPSKPISYFYLFSIQAIWIILCRGRNAFVLKKLDEQTSNLTPNAWLRMWADCSVSEIEMVWVVHNHEIVEAEKCEESLGHL